MELPEQASFKGFSCPTEAFDEPFLHTVIVQYARAILEVFLDRFRDELKQCAGVTDRLEVLAAEAELNTVWSPGLTMCFRAASLQDSSLAHKAAADVLLHAAANGLKGDWELELTKPSFFLWDSWLLPKCDYLSVSNEGKTASVVTRREKSESRILFHRKADLTARWTCDGDGIPLHSISTDCGPMLLLNDGILNPSDLDGFHERRPPAETISTAVLSNFENTLDLFRGPLRSYGNWVGRVIRTAAVTDLGELDDLQGTVFPSAAGAVFIYDGQDVLSQAETLIHGAAHNYFYLLTALGSPVNSLGSELYYSPFVRMMRTFDRVLASYHAFANGFLFYRACSHMLGGEVKQVCAERMKNTLPALRQAEQIIKENQALTPIGAALIEPLIEELRDEN